MGNFEYTATEIRKLLQGLFPQRRLVLSQLTFFNHAGVSKPSGNSFRRGRRCYRLVDILSIACVLALKEEGIPLKNVELLPQLIQENSERIFAEGPGCWVSGCGEKISLTFRSDNTVTTDALENFLQLEGKPLIFWGFDVGQLAQRLTEVAQSELAIQYLKAA